MEDSIVLAADEGVLQASIDMRIRGRNRSTASTFVACGKPLCFWVSKKAYTLHV